MKSSPMHSHSRGLPSSRSSLILISCESCNRGQQLGQTGVTEVRSRVATSSLPVRLQSSHRIVEG